LPKTGNLFPICPPLQTYCCTTANRRSGPKNEPAYAGARCARSGATKSDRNCNVQRQSQPSSRAALTRPARPQPPQRPLSTRAHTSRLSQIPIAECAAFSAHHLRGFVPWRLSDAGRHASGTALARRHPKPCTAGDSRTVKNGTTIRSPRRRWRAALVAPRCRALARFWH
jgi:hypothetical protein